MRLQHEVAKMHDLTFLRTAAQVREFAEKERLEELTGNADYELGAVSFPYARAAVKLFIERLAAQYHAATGEKLVVTSLTRPLNRQPRNASPLSVHPTGIAVDLRVPRSSLAKKWLEKTLLELERTGVLDATRERRPAHYHVAVFPESYESYLAEVDPSALMRDAVAAVNAIPRATMASVIPMAPSGESLDASESADYRLLLTGALAFFAVSVLGGGLTLQRARRRGSRQPD
jgi:hypothetical protein